MLITDGLIGSEHEVLQAIAHGLPASSRVHTIGVGSGVNRSLTQPAARAGRGVELVVGLGEDVEVGVKRLLARTSQPLVTEVTVTGSAVVDVAPQRVPDVYGGSPALISVQLRPEGGDLVIRGKTALGDLEERVVVKPLAHGEGSRVVATLFGRERVEDLEQNRVIEGHGQSAHFDGLIEKAGLEFQISTRLTSWVAVSQLQTVDPRAPRRVETQPQAPVFGLSAEGVGLRSLAAPSAPGGGMNQLRGLSSLAPVVATEAKRKLSKDAPSVQKEEAFSSLRVRDDAGAAEDESADFAAGEPEALPPEEPTGASSLPRPAPPKAAAPASLSEKGRAKAPARSSSAPEQKKQGLGLGDLMRKAFGLGSSEGGDGERAETVAEPASAAQVIRRFVASLARWSGRRLSVSFEVDQAFTWAPLSVRLELTDGSFVDAAVVVELTTTPGTYGPKVTIRSWSTPGAARTTRSACTSKMAPNRSRSRCNFSPRVERRTRHVAGNGGR